MYVGEAAYLAQQGKGQVGVVIRGQEGLSTEAMNKIPIPDFLAKAFEELSALASSSIEELNSQLNNTLNHILPPRFRSIRGNVSDSTGQTTEEFGAVIYDTSQFGSEGDCIPANAVAAVIDTTPTLNLERLRAAYERIAGVKRLKKGDTVRSREGIVPTTVTFGIIFSIDSVVPVEKLAEELDRQNRSHDFRQWADMTVVLLRGSINFTLQFPGEEPVGDFLPLPQGDVTLVPAYIWLFARPGGRFSLERMCWLLIWHLATFTGEGPWPKQADYLEEGPQIGVNICAYQFNTHRQLRPVPEEHYVTSKFFAPLPIRIEDNRGNLLSHLQFLPWQDGGIIRVIGKLPLEPFLVFIGRSDAIKDAITVNRKESKLSSILPISEDDFRTMLGRIRAQSNMVVKSEKAPNWIVSKAYDEGTSTPFYARLFAGILGLRDKVFMEHGEREKFDANFEAVLSALESTRSAAHEIVDAEHNHQKKLATGEIVKFRGTVPQINEDINRVLRKNTETFLNSAVRALKDGMQRLVENFGVDIGFLYKKQSPFLAGVKKLRDSDPYLADYLVQTRQMWSERLIDTRNKLHSGWVLERVKYSADLKQKQVKMTLPLVDNEPISQFVMEMLDRSCCFVEELTAYTLQKHLPEFISLTEIPPTERKPEFPERFRIALTSGGLPIWRITFHQRPFDKA